MVKTVSGGEKKVVVVGSEAVGRVGEREARPQTVRDGVIDT